MRDVRVFVEAVANLERGNSLGETRCELCVDGGLDVYAIRAYARLARAAELAHNHACGHSQFQARHSAAGDVIMLMIDRTHPR